MAPEKERIQETISELENFRETVKHRHSDNVSLTLRFDTVLKQLIDGLSTTVGSKIATAPTYGFTPKPITTMVGNTVSGEPSEKVIEDKEIQTFVENVNAVYDVILGRDNADILSGTDHETIRGVAKLAGLQDFKEATVNDAYITSIKNAITAKNQTDFAKKQALNELHNEEGGISSTEVQTQASDADDATDVAGNDVATTENTARPSVAELKAFKEKAIAEYTELFGAAPDDKLTGPKIQELIDQKKADGSQK